MDSSTLTLIASIMAIVAGLAGLLGFHAGKKRQGANVEQEDSREAHYKLDLRGLPDKEANKLRLIHKTMEERLPYARREAARKMFKRKVWMD